MTVLGLIRNQASIRLRTSKETFEDVDDGMHAISQVVNLNLTGISCSESLFFTVRFSDLTEFLSSLIFFLEIPINTCTQYILITCLDTWK